jgi:methyltransferase
VLGAPQIAAFLVLCQRGIEEWYSARNTRHLISQGAREVGGDYYPVVAVTHLGWIASLFALIPADAPVYWPLIALYLLLQVARYWIIFSLGPYWTHRIFTLKGAPIVRRGPYRCVRHPNYVVTIAETFVLPAAFGAFALAVIMTCIWGAVIAYKIVLEDAALMPRRESGPPQS